MCSARWRCGGVTWIAHHQLGLQIGATVTQLGKHPSLGAPPWLRRVLRLTPHHLLPLTKNYLKCMFHSVGPKLLFWPILKTSGAPQGPLDTLHCRVVSYAEKCASINLSTSLGNMRRITAVQT